MNLRIMSWVSLFVLFLIGTSSSFGGLERIGYNQGYQPEQPIPFDHSLHAGRYQIPCLNCHVQADKNRYATVPSLNICLNCHRNVAIDKPSIQKLTKAYEKGYSVPWLKVHLLPDFVMFNHQPHVKAGVKCQTCHGPVEEMREVYQFSDLSMGWCLDCHRNPEKARDLDWEKKKELTEVHRKAPESCGTCHY